MRITDIYDDIVSLSSSIRNAYIAFSQMTVSAVAIVTDVVSGGRPVVGYGFNSNGRYAHRYPMHGPPSADYELAVRHEFAGASERLSPALVK